MDLLHILEECRTPDEAEAKVRTAIEAEGGTATPAGIWRIIAGTLGGDLRDTSQPDPHAAIRQRLGLT